MKKNIAISLGLGTALSILALYLAFRNVPFSDLAAYFTSINYFWTVPAVLIGLFTFVLRTFRWRIILESAQAVSFWQAFHPMMIGFMINCVLPGRVGEVARPIILQKNQQVPFSTGLATVAAERVFDVGLLIIFLIGVLGTVQVDPHLSIAFGKYHLNRQTLEMLGASMVKLGLVLIAGILMVSFDATRKVINRVIMGIPSLFFFAGSPFKDKIIQKVCTPTVRMVENFASGLSLVKYPKKIVLCIGLSLAVWILSALAMYLMARGCPGIELSFMEMTAVLVIICFFIALPSAPGFWGLWEAGGVFALSLFGVSSRDAAGFTLANHAIQMFPVIIVGFVSAVLTGVNIWRISFDQRRV